VDRGDAARGLLPVIPAAERDQGSVCPEDDEAAGRRWTVPGRWLGVRLNAEHLAGLGDAIEDVLRRAREHPDDDGVWTTILWTAVDRQDQ